MKNNVSRWGSRVAVAVLGSAVVGMALVVPAQADPLWPGGPDIPGIPSLPLPQQPGPPPAPDVAPAITPANGEVVGGERPIDIHFNAPIKNRAATQKTVQITPSVGVPGHFTWVNDTDLQWRPNDYWPRGTAVTVQANGSKSAFNVSDKFEGLGDAKSHKFIVKIGGDVVKTFPASFGKPGHPSPNGTFPVLEKFAEMVMDSSTYGVPVDSPQGYKLNVQYATRLTWDGVFVHAAPWSVDQQGNSNVSHGCINLSTANAKWYFDNVRKGDTVTIVNAG